MRFRFGFTLALASLTVVASCSSSSSTSPDAADPADDAPPDVTSDVTSDAPPGDAPSEAIDAPAIAPRLTVSHEQILDPAGKPILLRGWNWGDWGTEQPEDASKNAAQGANAVRIPVRWWGGYPAWMNARDDASPGHMSPARLAELDHTIADAAAAHLWIILFLDSNCGQASPANDVVADCGTGADGLPANFMNDTKSRDAFFELWKFIAARYASAPYIGMYELLPEPNFGCKGGVGCSDWSVSNKFYASLLPIVRSVDPRTPVLVGPNGGYEMKQIETSFMPGTEGVIYTGNLLQHGASDPASVGVAKTFRAAHDVPVFIQQLGVPKSNATATDIVNRVMGELRDAGIGFTWWTYREPYSAGNGFAPYYGTPWKEDATWLALITSYFR